MKNSISKKDFWNTKILSWDQKSYQNKSLLNYNLHYRMIETARLVSIAQKSSKKKLSILELGCGTGRLIDYLNINDFHYKGIDIAKSAILKAQQTYKKDFEQADFKDINSLDKYDLIISLGFIDWIDKEDIEKLATLCKNKQFIHSFTNKNNKFNFYYTLYRKLLNEPYSPTRYSESDIRDKFFNSQVIKSKKLGICRIITNVYNC